MSNSTCSYRFSSEGGRFIDYIEAARASPQSKLTTQPNLGLLDIVHESDEGSSGEDQGWGGLARYVNTVMTRENLGYHTKYCWSCDMAVASITL
ncbi:hypothetical protein NW767_012266 [Fusarium falciforme]|nr:hypothetical protein NW767_012266 [Fusarium falciforme]